MHIHYSCSPLTWCSSRPWWWSHSWYASNQCAARFFLFPSRSAPRRCRTSWCRYRWPAWVWLRPGHHWRRARRRARFPGRRSRCAIHSCLDSCTATPASASNRVAAAVPDSTQDWLNALRIGERMEHGNGRTTQDQISIRFRIGLESVIG